ncbi:RidA family protein [Candidatus Mycoplasma mahonii]|uniref:RidA family protein n=1 Tax=Candidatus Mycoplasma mahonii TaxID=3004105 RepID=UPI0026EACCF9|nr:RidA family protein [Candidatus Mycoplasma mahonii]WKX02746.1 RidA family protein [Candidatus Mycoplasma mahonii]
MKIINSKNAPSAIGPYSHAVAANGMLYVSGQIPFAPKMMICVGGGIREQTKQSLENLKAVITEAGTSLDKVVKVGVFLKDLKQFNDMNEVYATYFNHHKPARTCLEVARLPKDVLIEIEAIVSLT